MKTPLSISNLNRTLPLAACFLALMGEAPATTISLDGVYSAGEYSGAISGSKSLLWWNGHESIYTKAAGNMNPLRWEINANDNGKYSLNTFFEVPDYARRMIWKTGVDYNGTNFDPAWGIAEGYLDAYLEGAKNADPLDPLNKKKWHHDSVKMDYNTQTGSEYFQLNAGSTSLFKEIKWQNVDANGLSDGFTWKTSLEYILDNGLGTTSESLNFDMTSSIELMWNSFDSQDDALAYLDRITDMELHLSDEARGLPPRGGTGGPGSRVPDGGSTLVCLGIALLGLGSVRKLIGSKI